MAIEFQIEGVVEETRTSIEYRHKRLDQIRLQGHKIRRLGHNLRGQRPIRV